MLNRLIEKDVKNNLSNANLVIDKNDYGIEVYISKPIFEDIGTYIYKNKKDIDKDYDEIIKLNIK